MGGATTSCTPRRFRTSPCSRLRCVRRYRLVVDWHEVWSRDYWREYLGRAGVVGWRVQRRCARVPQTAFCFSRLHARRLRELGLRAEPHVLEGEYAGPRAHRVALPRRAGGRVRGPAHPGEAACRRSCQRCERPASALPDLRGAIFGDGPGARERRARAGRRARARRSRRGAGLRRPARRRCRAARRPLPGPPVAARGLRPRGGRGVGARRSPSMVVAGPDNAATELVDDGVNGFVAASAEPDDLAAAIAARPRGRRGAAPLDRGVVPAQRPERALAGPLARVVRSPSIEARRRDACA